MQSIFRLPKVLTLTPGYIYTKIRQLIKPIVLWDIVIDLERKANGICKHERLRI
jgi:hypothetical protein